MQPRVSPRVHCLRVDVWLWRTQLNHSRATSFGIIKQCASLLRQRNIPITDMCCADKPPQRAGLKRLIAQLIGRGCGSLAQACSLALAQLRCGLHIDALGERHRVGKPLEAAKKPVGDCPCWLFDTPNLTRVLAAAEAHSSPWPASSRPAHTTPSRTHRTRSSDGRWSSDVRWRPRPTASSPVAASAVVGAAAWAAGCSAARRSPSRGTFASTQRGRRPTASRLTGW